MNHHPSKNSMLTIIRAHHEDENVTRYYISYVIPAAMTSEELYKGTHRPKAARAHTIKGRAWIPAVTITEMPLRQEGEALPLLEQAGARCYTPLDLAKCHWEEWAGDDEREYKLLPSLEDLTYVRICLVDGVTVRHNGRIEADKTRARASAVNISLVAFLEMLSAPEPSDTWSEVVQVTTALVGRGAPSNLDRMWKVVLNTVKAHTKITGYSVLSDDDVRRLLGQ